MLLKSQILIALYSVRSERLFCERLQYDFLFRWFLDLPGVGTGFDATTFSKNRQRLLEAEIFEEFSLKSSIRPAGAFFCPTNTSRWTAR
jgi:transposase